MQLELAEDDLSAHGGYRGYRAEYPVRDYDRKANHVPGYKRHYPRLSDSSLMTFKLADGSIIQMPASQVPGGLLPRGGVSPSMIDVTGTGCNCSNGKGYWSKRPDGSEICIVDRTKCSGGASLMDGNGYLFLTVPDPANKQAPRLVREDMFDNLPDAEFEKLILYAEPFNDQQTLQAIINNHFAQSGMNDNGLVQVVQQDTANGIVAAATAAVPNGTTILPTSILDGTTLGIPNKDIAIGVGAYLLFKLL